MLRRLPQRNRRCRLMAGIPWHSATGSVGSAHGTINLVSEAPLMFLKLTPRLLRPPHTLQIVPNQDDRTLCM
jgi:hypothetical protein